DETLIEAGHLDHVRFGCVQAALGLVHERLRRALNEPATGERNHIEKVEREGVVIVSEPFAKDGSGSEQLLPGRRYGEPGFGERRRVKVEDPRRHRDRQRVQTAVYGTGCPGLRIEL